MPLHLTYDATTDVAYLELRATGPADVMGPALYLEHDRALKASVIADFTPADGCLVGFEFQFASACLPHELLATAERIDGQNLGCRFGERIARLLASNRPATKGPRSRGH
jgi:uncharacterized protein YuzE